MQSPKQLIEYAMKVYNNDQFILWYSGGNDSTSTLHATLKAQRETEKKFKLRMMYWNTGINLEENKEFVYHMANKNGLELIEIRPEPHFNYESLTSRFGFLSNGGHNISLGFLKWFGFRKWAREHKQENIVYISGRRKLESTKRAVMISNKPLDKPESNMNIVSPIFYLNNKQRDLYMQKHNLIGSPCYATIHADGNCQCGTNAGRDELKMMYIFHKNTFESIHRLEDKYGGKRIGKVIEELKICPNCNKEGFLIGGDTRWINGIHCYTYDCLKCFTKLQVPDDKMPYHLAEIDYGYWGNGVNTKEILAEPPPPDDLICHGCKMAYELKKKVIYNT